MSREVSVPFVVYLVEMSLEFLPLALTAPIVPPSPLSLEWQEERGCSMSPSVPSAWNRAHLQ